ncbi:hypothetical protein [Neolewinella sp.]|uniref:hypothetical protein n=1 Tax=Neolewinella sp. TaxID=2993543 RepID=UPI003B52A88E
MTKPLVSREEIKDAIREMLTEDPGIFKGVVKEVLEDAPEARRERIRKIVMEDFKELDKVFRALA